MHISVEAPSRSNGMSLPGGIQRQQEEQEGTPAIEHQVSAKKAETSTGELSNLTRATEGPLQPKTDRGRLNWGNISVEAPTRSGEASPQPIQRQQQEQEETPEIQAQLAADSAEKTAGESSNSTITSAGEALQPKIARAPFNGRNIPVEAPQSSATSSTYPEGIQRLETSGVKEQEKSTESLQMQPEEEIQAKSSSGEPQEKEEQNKELVQTKLTVGAPGDKYEQEADSMAAKVMRMPESAIKPPIQRQTGEETEAVQMQPLVNSITPVLQRSSGEQEEVQMKLGVQRASDGSSQASGPPNFRADAEAETKPLAKTAATKALNRFDMSNDPKAYEAVLKAWQDTFTDKFVSERVSGSDIKPARQAAQKLANTEASKVASSRAIEAARQRAKTALQNGDAFKHDPNTEAVRNDYARGAQGGNAKSFSPRFAGRTVAEIIDILDTDVPSGRCTKSPSDLQMPNGQPPKPQIGYQYPDGTLVRVKPNGDAFLNNPMYSVEVTNNTSGPVTGQEDIAFKVGTDGKAVPKGPNDVNNPYKIGTNPEQYNTYLE